MYRRYCSLADKERQQLHQRSSIRQQPHLRTWTLLYVDERGEPELHSVSLRGVAKDAMKRMSCQQCASHDIIEPTRHHSHLEGTVQGMMKCRSVATFWGQSACRIEDEHFCRDSRGRCRLRFSSTSVSGQPPSLERYCRMLP